MPPIIDYVQLFEDYFETISQLQEDKKRIEAELRTRINMARSAIAFMTDEERDKLQLKINAIDQQRKTLTEAIRDVFYQMYRVWMTPVVIRQWLIETGFDFTSYTSDPLISIHSTLKRFKKSEVRSSRLADGSMGYMFTQKAYKEREALKKRQLSIWRHSYGSLEMEKEPCTQPYTYSTGREKTLTEKVDEYLRKTEH